MTWNFYDSSGSVKQRPDFGLNPIIGNGLIWNGSGWGSEPVSRILDRSPSTVDVVSTTSEVTIYSKVIPGGIMGTDKVLRLTVWGDILFNNSTTNTWTHRIKLGATTWTLSLEFNNPGISATRRPMWYEVEIINLGSASSQHVRVAGLLTNVTNTSNVPRAAMHHEFFSGTVDTSVQQTLVETIQWGTSSANNSWRKRYALLELL